MKISNNGTKEMYSNISKYMLLFLFFGLVFVKFTLFNYVEIAYLSKRVRKADSLSSVQSVNLITRFSSNESLQYWGDEWGLLLPDLCIPSRLFFCHSTCYIAYVITKIKKWIGIYSWWETEQSLLFWRLKSFQWNWN